MWLKEICIATHRKMFTSRLQPPSFGRKEFGFECLSFYLIYHISREWIGVRSSYYQLSMSSNIFLISQISLVTFASCDPGQKNFATVFVTVVRNRDTPSFSRNRFNLEILETVELGEVLLQLTAEDDDLVRGNYFIRRALFIREVCLLYLSLVRCCCSWRLRMTIW